MCLFLLILVPIVIFGCRCVNPETIHDQEGWMKALLTNYNKNFRPVYDQAESVNVNMTFELAGIQEFNEVLQKFSVIGIFYYQWIDERMTWDPFVHNMTWTISLPPTAVWTPGVVLSNTFGKIEPVRADWVHVRYYPDGRALWTPGDVFPMICKVDVTYYPFDVQECDMLLIPWGHLASELTLQSNLDHVRTTYFVSNGVWDFIGSDIKTEVSDGPDIFSIITVTIKVRRHSSFFVINVVLPVVFMGFLNIFAFLLPPESGERASYAITVLLSTAIFLTIVSANLPKTSHPMSVLSYFMMIQLVLSTVICVMSVLNLRVYFKHNRTPVPHWMAAITRRLLYGKPKLPKRINPIDDNNVKLETIVEPEFNGIHEKKTNGWNVRHDVEITWRDVSRLLDRLFFVLSAGWLLASFSTFAILVLVKVPLQSNT